MSKQATKIAGYTYGEKEVAKSPIRNMADHNSARTESDSQVKHRTVEIDGIRIFYREAGPPDAPVVLLPHGYPSSSFQFRNFMPAPTPPLEVSGRGSSCIGPFRKTSADSSSS